MIATLRALQLVILHAVVTQSSDVDARNNGSNRTIFPCGEWCDQKTRTCEPCTADVDDEIKFIKRRNCDAKYYSYHNGRERCPLVTETDDSRKPDHTTVCRCDTYLEDILPRNQPCSLSSIASVYSCVCQPFYEPTRVRHMCVLSLSSVFSCFFFCGFALWFNEMVVISCLLMMCLFYCMSFAKHSNYENQPWYKVSTKEKLSSALQRTLDARAPVPCELCCSPHRNTIGVSSGFCSKSHQTLWVADNLQAVQDRCRSSIRHRGSILFMVGCANVIVSVVLSFYMLHLIFYHIGIGGNCREGNGHPDGLIHGFNIFMLFLLMVVFCVVKIVFRFVSKTLQPRLHADNLLRSSEFMQVEADFVTQYVPGFSFDKFTEEIAEKRAKMIREYDDAWETILRDEQITTCELTESFEQAMQDWNSDRVSNDYVMKDAELTQLFLALMSPYEFETRQNKYKTRIFQASENDVDLYTHANCTLLLLTEVLEAVCGHINQEPAQRCRKSCSSTSSASYSVPPPKKSKKKSKVAHYCVDIKKPLRLRKKTAEDDSAKGTDCLHTCDFGRVLDICRGSVYCHSLYSVEKAVEFFAQCNGREFHTEEMTGNLFLIRLKDRLLHDSLDGYRAITMNLLFEMQFAETFHLADSQVFKYHIVEVQLHLADILEKKTQGGGPVVYKWLRRQLHNRDRYYLLLEKKRGKRSGRALSTMAESDGDRDTQSDIFSATDSSKTKYVRQFAASPSWHSTFSIMDMLREPAEIIHRPKGTYKLILDLRELQRLKHKVQGLIISADGGVYEGGLMDGLRDGEGEYTFPMGDRLQIIWQGDLPHGLGHYYWANGSDVVGRWRRGLPHGKFCFHVVASPKPQCTKYNYGDCVVSWGTVYQQFFRLIWSVTKRFVRSFIGLPHRKEVQNVILQPPPHSLTAQQKSNIDRIKRMMNSMRNNSAAGSRSVDGNAVDKSFSYLEKFQNEITRAVSTRTPGGDSRPRTPGEFSRPRTPNEPSRRGTPSYIRRKTPQPTTEPAESSDKQPQSMDSYRDTDAHGSSEVNHEEPLPRPPAVDSPSCDLSSKTHRVSCDSNTCRRASLDRAIPTTPRFAMETTPSRPAPRFAPRIRRASVLQRRDVESQDFFDDL